MGTIVWRRRANRPQQYIKILMETAIEAIRLKILKVKKPTVKGTEAKLRILVKEDI